MITPPLKSIFRALALAAAVSACATTPATPPAPRSELAQRIQADQARLNAELAAADIIAIGLNETASLGGGVRVRVLNVIEDSRCPSDVTCIWAGRLRVRANISGAEHELTLGEPLQLNGKQILLALAAPSPWSDWPEAELGARPAYRFGFRRA